MKRLLIICLFLDFLSSFSLWAQQPAVLTLSQAVEGALAQGADSKVLAKNLEIGRQQYSLSVSQNSFALSGSVGENASYGFGDETLLGDNLLSSGFSQTPQAGLTIAAPLTSIGVTIMPYQPASTLASDFSPCCRSFPQAHPS